MDDLFVESQSVTRNQIARGCTPGGGLVIGVLAWIEDEIVDPWVDATEAKGNVVSEEASGARVVPAAVKDQDMPFGRRPCQKQEAGVEEIVVEDIGENSVSHTSGPAYSCVVICQLNRDVGTCLNVSRNE
jgi:hypothetical protein